MKSKRLKQKQEEAIKRLSAKKRTILVAPTGTGKTVICLSAINSLLDRDKLKRVIVAVPAKVLETLVWENEVAKWGHLRNLTILQITGTSQQRTRQLLSCLSDIIVISLNNLDWLLDQDHGCDGIVVDELSKAAGKQTRGLTTKRRGGCFRWRVGMTATPVSMNFEKLHPMTKRIDGGKALGKNKREYLDEYFYSDYMGYNWTLKNGASKRIMKRIHDLVHIVDGDKEETLPPLTEKVIRFQMPPDTRVAYNEMKKDMTIKNHEAANAAVRDGKLRQLSSGFFYDEDKNVEKLDDARIDAAVDWFVDCDKRPAIIFYEYVQQHQRLKKVFAHYCADNVMDFLAGEGRLLLAQINSLSHGVDGLQYRAKDALIFHPMWSRDATQQAIGRLHRLGQKNEVTITTLVCDNTLDDLVMKRVDDRAIWMKLFTEHMRST